MNDIKAPKLLNKAAAIMEERGKQYDRPDGERSMGKCVIAFNAITDKDLSEAEGWLLLQLLKDVRLWQRPGYHADSAEDCIAYAALKAEAKSQEFAELLKDATDTMKAEINDMTTSHVTKTFYQIKLPENAK